MVKLDCEHDMTWSSIEANYSYDKVVWQKEKNGIPSFTIWCN